MGARRATGHRVAMAPLQPVFPIATRLWKSAKVSEMGVRVSGADFVGIRLEPASGVTTVCEALWRP